MYIFGSTKEDKLLVVATRDEIAQMAGFHNRYSQGAPSVEVGATIPIGDIFNDAKAVLETHYEAAESAKKLRAAGDKFASYFAKSETKDQTKKKT